MTTQDEANENETALMAKDLAQDCVLEFILAELMRGRTPAEKKRIHDGMRDRARYRMKMRAAELVVHDAMKIQTLAIDFLDALLSRIDET